MDNDQIVPHSDSSDNPSVFDFNGQPIRSFMKNGLPWFIAADGCKVLDISDTSRAVSRLDEDEKGTTTIRTPGGMQIMITVNEYGLYSLILTSRKPEAKAFKRWIIHEVLPALRQSGVYAIRPASPIQQLRTMLEVMEQHDTELHAHENRIKALEANIQPQIEHFSVLAYWSEHGRTISANEAAHIGKAATKLSRDRNIGMGEVPDSRYGHANTYHKSILAELFIERS